MRPNHFRLVAGLAVVVFAVTGFVVGCGSEGGVTCGPGTVAKSGQCLPHVDGQSAADGSTTDAETGVDTVGPGPDAATTQTTCGKGTRKVGDECVIDDKALLPKIAKIGLRRLDVSVPTVGKIFTLHGASVSAVLDIQGDAFDSYAVLGVRSADGSQRCAIGTLAITLASASADKTQPITIQGEMLVQSSCEALVAAKDTRFFLSFDPFQKTLVAGRTLPDQPTAEKLLAASELGFADCDESVPVPAKGVPATKDAQLPVIRCGQPVAVVKSPGRDPHLSGDIDLGTGVMEIDAFDPAVVAALAAPGEATSIAPDVALPPNEPVAFEDLQGRGDQTPHLRATVGFRVFGMTDQDKLDDGDIALEFAIRPSGTAGSDADKSWEKLVTQLQTAGKAGEESTIEFLEQQFLESIAGPYTSSRNVPLYAPKALQARLTLGDWSNNALFDLRTCIATEFKEQGGDAVTTNNCAVRTVLLLRNRVQPNQGTWRDDAVPTASPPVPNPGGGSLGASEEFQATLPGWPNYYHLMAFSYSWSGIPMWYLITRVGGAAFVNLSTSAYRWDGAWSSHVFSPGVGVFGLMMQYGWDPVVDLLGSNQVQLWFYRPADQPFDNKLKGIFSFWRPGLFLQAHNTTLIDFTFFMPVLDMTTAASITIVEVTFWKIVSAGIETLGENKSGMKFYLEAGVEKQMSAFKVEGVDVKVVAKAAVQVSMSMEKKLSDAKFGNVFKDTMPAECNDPTKSLKSPSGTHCYYRPAMSGNHWQARDACIAKGGHLYAPNQGYALPDDWLSTQTNIPIAKLLPLAKNNLVQPTAAELKAFAFTTPDPLGFLVNLPGALMLDATKVGIVTTKQPNTSGCPSACLTKINSPIVAGSYNLNDCFLHPACTVAGGTIAAARQAAIEVAAVFPSWNHVGRREQMEWVFNYNFSAPNVSKNAAALVYGEYWARAWTRDCQVNQTQNAGNWGDTHLMYIHGGDMYLSYVGDNAGHKLTRFVDELYEKAKNTIYINGGKNTVSWALKGSHSRMPAPRNLPSSFAGNMGDYDRNVFGFFSTFAASATAPALCEIETETLSGVPAETFTVTLTPGAEAAASASVNIGGSAIGTGYTMSVVLFEAAVPVSLAAARTLNNVAARLAVVGEATIALLKAKLEVWVKPLVTTLKFSIFDLGPVAQWEWTLFGPYTSNYGCGSGGCSVK